MEELLKTLQHFNQIMLKQINSLFEFVTILDEEEQTIVNYDLSSLEKVVIVKDQHSRIALSLEEKRILLAKKICYLIAFDPRGNPLTLSLLSQALHVYIKNVATLISPETYQKLTETEINFLEIKNKFESAFKNVQPRIFRNQIVVKKLLRNVNLSISLFQTEAELGLNYDSLGKTQFLSNSNQTISSLRVKA